VLLIFFFKKETDEEVFVVFLEAVALLKMEVVAFVRAHRACLNIVTCCCCCCCCVVVVRGMAREAKPFFYPLFIRFRVSENFEKLLKKKT